MQGQTRRAYRLTSKDPLPHTPAYVGTETVATLSILSTKDQPRLKASSIPDQDIEPRIVSYEFLYEVEGGSHRSPPRSRLRALTAVDDYRHRLDRPVCPRSQERRLTGLRRVRQPPSRRQDIADDAGARALKLNQLYTSMRDKQRGRIPIFDGDERALYVVHEPDIDKYAQAITTPAARPSNRQRAMARRLPILGRPSIVASRVVSAV